MTADWALILGYVLGSLTQIGVVIVFHLTRRRAR